MIYVVEMEKTIRRTVLVEAQNDEECDRKLQADKIKKEWLREDSNHAYGNWTYKDGGHYTVDSEDDIITCAADIARLYGYDGEEHLDKALFKNTACGMCADWDEEKITLVGYVEGADCDGPSQTLFFPFTVKLFRDVRDRLDNEASEMWHEWNDTEDI